MLARELIAFGTAGAINTALGMIVFNIVLGLGAFTASIISTAIATASSYTLNRYVTYRHRPRTALRRELPLFVLFNLIGLGIQLGILKAATDAFSLTNGDRLELNFARFGGVAVGTVFLLITYRTFVFKKAAAEVVPAPAVTTTAVLTGSAVPVQSGTPITRGGQIVDPDAEFAELTGPLEADQLTTDIEAAALDVDDLDVDDLGVAEVGTRPAR